ncbi:hypothetical protein GCM10010129_73440 [Streptomyces fumigatiscleroticus]|nr:hypothetical protein GCM10010129_73440 [Streptomyces fumigatiscleroticus]
MNDSERDPEFLLVHGAWHGSWCWRELQDVLAGRGLTSHTVDLPSIVPAGSGGRLPGLLDDARVIREKIDAVQARLVVVGHSYGGAPVTQATPGAANVSQHVGDPGRRQRVPHRVRGRLRPGRGGEPDDVLRR